MIKRAAATFLVLVLFFAYGSATACPASCLAAGRHAAASETPSGQAASGVDHSHHTGMGSSQDVNQRNANPIPCCGSAGFALSAICATAHGMMVPQLKVTPANASLQSPVHARMGIVDVVSIAAESSNVQSVPPLSVFNQPLTISLRI